MRAIAVVLAAIMSALLAASPARADQFDADQLNADQSNADQSNYVSYLDGNGVAYRNLPGVIAVGKEDVCHPLRDGGGIDTVIGDVVDFGYTGEETAFIIIGAIRYLCPDQLPVLQDWRAAHSAGPVI